MRRSPSTAAQFLQQAVTVVQQARVAGATNGEVLRCPEPQRGHLQDQARQVRAAGSLGPCIRVPGREILLRVQAYADAVADAAATSPCGCSHWARDTGSIGRRLEFASVAVDGLPGPARRPDESAPRNGERGLRDVRSEHRPPPGCGSNTFSSLPRTTGRTGGNTSQSRCPNAPRYFAHLGDLALARQEHELIALDALFRLEQFVERVATASAARAASVSSSLSGGSAPPTGWLRPPRR